MDALALAALEHENWISYLAASAALNAAGLVLRDGGIATLLGLVPMRFYNQILVESHDAATAAMRDSVALARERGAPFLVSLRDGTDDRLQPLMGELRLRAADDAVTQAMAMHPLSGRRTSARDRRGFGIEHVADGSGLADHRAVVTAGFGADPSVGEAMLGIGLLEHPECAVYVGYLDGRPVASGLGWRTGRTIGVYNIATIPGARRRGFGEAMTARVVADGEAAGCDVATLQASSMGRPIYERMGFRASVRYAGYVDLPAEHTPGPYGRRAQSSGSTPGDSRANCSSR